MFRFLTLEEFHSLSAVSKQSYTDALMEELLKRRTELDELEERPKPEIPSGEERPH